MISFPKKIKIGLKTPVRYLKGVGPQVAAKLARLGIQTVGDLLYFFPRAYQDRTAIKKINQLASGDEALVIAIVKNVKFEPKKKGMSLVRAVVSDSSGEELEALWFNQPYLLSYLKRGQELFLMGKVTFNAYRGALEMLVREYEKVEAQKEREKIVPLYALTEGLHQKFMRKSIKQVLALCLDECIDYLPVALVEELHLPPLKEAIDNLHFPADLAGVLVWRKRLVFDEFLVFQLALFLLRDWRKRHLVGIKHVPNPVLIKEFEKGLSFKLTAAQQKVIAEIQADMTSPTPMNRLLQGEVGSGKTIVAVFAALLALGGGYQVAIMAPTEILAQQHYLKISDYLEKLGFKVRLLVGSLKAREKKQILEEIAQGKVQVIIGTHALIEEGVKFKQLGLVIIDEQHRFGVRQRALLLGKGLSPDLLVMTATPIPRTLALTLYGDLDRSVIDELPPGRLPVKTHYVPQNKRQAAYEFICKEIEAGRQVFVVCPLIEESEALSIKAVLAEGEYLQKEVFSEFKVSILHGRLKTQEKEAIMQAFKQGKVQVLVSTSVIEVGIDIPNATVMLVEHAERFGLSQLHQLRGRIGRNNLQSYCLLFGEPTTEEGKQRLQALVKSSDGFEIAEADLRIRGPGDFFGVTQAGLPPFRVADIIRDEDILRLARQKAQALLAADPLLNHPNSALLKQEVFCCYGEVLGVLS